MQPQGRSRVRQRQAKDRVVIVTGAGRGIGIAVALRFAQDGARVAVVDLLQERADAVAAKIQSVHGTAIARACDVSDASAVERTVADVVQQFGRVDVLINCAGAYRDPKMAHETPEETWDLVIDSNLKGTFLFCKAVLPHMQAQKSGRIVNFASNAARSVATGLGPEYTAAKAGILGLTRHIAKQYAPFGILVNAIAPGPTMVPRLYQGKTQDYLDHHAGMIPVGRLADPEEHAEVVFFMASDGATFMTGATVDNNGGIIMV
jgi:NAD(P)-dependent dehydrogenase (short-subunit alcohol dehydrogenase family)